VSDGFLCRKEAPRIDEKIFKDLKNAIIELDEAKAVKGAEAMMSQGIDPSAKNGPRRSGPTGMPRQPSRLWCWPMSKSGRQDQTSHQEERNPSSDNI
jgi:hypothetical protein